MSGYSRIALVGLTILIAGCKHTPVSILATGDSTMWGTQWDGQPLVPPTYTLQTLLKVPVENVAVPGSTLNQLINGKAPFYRKKLKQVLDESNASIVIENFGINDASLRKGVPLEQYKKDLQQFITMANEAGKIPVLEEPNRMCAPQASADYLGRLDEYVLALRKVAAANQVVLIAQYDALKQEYGEAYCSKLIDGFHPGRELARAKGRNEAGAVYELVNNQVNRFTFKRLFAHF